MLFKGVPHFTREPPSVLYVSSGGTARFVWDYYVSNRTTEFDPFSPVWSFYNKSGDKAVIGLDNAFNGWSFVLQKTCPPRLLNPTRVSKESTAILVITNATTADSGLYECRLFLTRSSPVKSRVHLVVTSTSSHLHFLIQSIDLYINS
jgi:hypothetical protein